MHFYFRISQFHFCKDFNYNENIMIFVRFRLFYGFTPMCPIMARYELRTIHQLTNFKYRAQQIICYFSYLM